MPNGKAAAAAGPEISTPDGADKVDAPNFPQLLAHSADSGVWWRMPRRPTVEYDFPPPKLVEPALPVSLPAPPSHLSEEMQAWWRQIVADFDMSSHHLHVLLCACDSFDRMTEAREILRKEGLTMMTAANGTKVHPCVAVERDSRNALMRAIRELDLDEPQPSPGRYMPPPTLRSNRRR